MLNHGFWFGKRKNLKIYAFLFLIFLLILLIPTVHAFLWSEPINIEPEGIESLTFDLTYGKIFYVRIWSINGTFDDSINIYVTNPNGNTILNLGNIRLPDHFREFEFRTWQDGNYTVYFDNSFSSSPKTVEYMCWSYEDTLLPAYYIGLAMMLILPPLVKYILGYGWFETLAISVMTIAFVMCILVALLYRVII